MEDNKNYIRVERHKWPDEIANEKKYTRKRFLIIISCLLCFASGFALSTLSNSTLSKTNTALQSQGSNKFNEIYELMKNEWYFGKDIENLDEFLLDNAINGLTTNEYDAHTNYLNSDTASQFLQKLEGSLVGLGIEYTKIDDDAMVTKVYIDSPAEKAGLKEGDTLTKINGISLADKTLNEISDLAKGEEGSIATIIVERDGKEISFDVTRATINMTTYGYVRNDVGILELSSFSEGTHEEVEAYFKKFKKENIDNIIIDMRNNTGGYLETVIKIASMLLDEDEVVLKEQKRDGKISEFKTTGGTKYDFNKIAVLVNGNTASASEALAICLKEQMDATIVGTTTYGKGTEQISKIFDDGTYLKYTIAEWLSPNGTSINLKGITPDVKIDNDEALSYRFDPEDAAYEVDSVGDNVKTAQIYLKFMGYTIDRTDGYFSNTTLTALKQFQSDQELAVNGVIDEDLLNTLYKKVTQIYSGNEEKYDIQLSKAIEVANGK